MKDQAQTDELIMTLVDLALALPEDHREEYVRNACGDDPELFSEVWNYVQWENRMKGFLLEPLYPPVEYEHPFEPGQLLINRFRILREIAQGGMGIVWEAFDEKLERRVAIKCAKTGFGKRLPPEVRNAREISHPNVCKIFEIHTAFTKQGEVDFISMEFLEGETLADRLRGAPLSKQESRTIARQLCSGLAEAHRNNVIHGDLKTNNIILTTGPQASVRAVITDFGLALRPGAIERTPSSALLAGTPDYMAPELWKGSKTSVASDIYALGVMLWELSSGRKPSELGIPSSTVPWGEHFTWKPPPAPGRWNRVIARCLDPDPTKRFVSAEAVAEALEPSRSRTRLVALATAVLVAISSGVVVYRRAVPPQEIVRVAMLPFESAPDTAPLADKLLQDTAGQLSRLTGNAHTKLSVVPAAAALHSEVKTTDQARRMLGASYTLQGTLKREHAKVVLHAYLTDTHSEMNRKEWDAEYTTTEMRYAPVALAGVVTEMLHLPPPSGATTVNAAARPDYLKGLSYLRRDTTVDAAVDSMTKAVAADPDSALTYAGLAEAQWSKYHATKDKTWLDRAEESVRLAEYRNPDLAAVHRIAGLLEATTGVDEAARVEYRRAIELEPGNSEAYRRLGMAYEADNQFEASLAAFHKAAEVQPGDFRVYQELGAFYFHRGDYGQAVKEFRKAVEAAPAEPRPHFNLANACINMGLYGEAEHEIRESIRFRETPDSLETLGLVLIYESKEREAISFLLRAANLNPDRYLTWLHLGICYRRTNQIAEAARANRRGLHAAETEMAKNPRSGWIRSSLAYLCANLQERQRAESEIAQALQLSPKDADTQFMAVLTNEALHRRDETLAVLSTSSIGTIADLSRWPDLADLHQDPRFLDLMAVHGPR